MRLRLVLLTTVSTLLLFTPFAHAQLAINVPVPAPDTLMPDEAAPLVPDESATMGSSPGNAAGVPDASTVVVYSDGTRDRVKVYADNAAVRSFDPAAGRLSLQDGTEVTFPANFAFVDTPEPGQPVTIYYFIDRQGTPVLSAIDMGLQGADSGGS